MTPEEAAHLGGTITESFLAWEGSLPLGVRRMFGGDRVLLLCATLLVRTYASGCPCPRLATCSAVAHEPARSRCRPSPTSS